jgi:hydroxymethylglutaryl-CoA synthase
MVVIIGHGGYVPLHRIDRAEIVAQHGFSASGESAVPGRDENHITMASEAAETALARAGLDNEDLSAVFSASVTDPFAEHGIASHVAYRYDATGDVRTADFGATPRAATDALATARAVVNATGGTVLVVGVDIMPVERGHENEPSAGACAGALLLQSEGVEPVATIEAIGQETTGFVERHREHGEAAEPGDQRFETEHGFNPAVQQAAQRALASGNGVPMRAVVNTHNQRAARSILTEVADDIVYDSTFDSVGYAGAASFFLDTVHMLEQAAPEETAIAMNYGAGGADVVAIEAGPGVGADENMTVAELLDAKETIPYAKHIEYREKTKYESASL